VSVVGEVSEVVNRVGAERGVRPTPGKQAASTLTNVSATKSSTSVDPRPNRRARP